jgi:mannonate dehydratase
MRWFGTHDPVSLMDIRQAGCSGIVTALHHIPVGEVWSIDEITKRKQLIEADNLKYTPLYWSVVESLPVHEDIKKGLATREIYIENYIQSLRNLATCGIYTVCYNFMPVLDWSRTDLEYLMLDGSKALRFVWEDFAMFDLCILKRTNAIADYDEITIQNAQNKFNQLNEIQLEKLKNTILLGLPGSEEAFALDTFQQLLDNYRDIDEGILRANLYYFIQKIAPIAEELGVRLCIHPDDPPQPLLGLPRVVSTENDLIQLTKAYDSIANGITFCTGSLGVRLDNDLVKIIEKLGEKIHFVHLRSTKRESNLRNFHEADHLEGDVNMYEVVKALILESRKRIKQNRIDFDIPMRPDHGHQMLDDLNTKAYPGYSAIGRLRGLAEIRGIEKAIAYHL